MKGGIGNIDLKCVYSIFALRLEWIYSTKLLSKLMTITFPFWYPSPAALLWSHWAMLLTSNCVTVAVANRFRVDDFILIGNGSWRSWTMEFGWCESIFVCFSVGMHRYQCFLTKNKYLYLGTCKYWVSTVQLMKNCWLMTINPIVTPLFRQA